ncbi:hypothetical protein HHL23_09585 [Chryseobacterium sp. RP-3-3]|uniref:Uncharacterized protein n=1 Tax=Chryseobacterium antibioticum TaxID=2728847 RepID=A0A7Y0AMP0_9FLAO|nr:hypothetical protein [Chryseobacterium antibioticum]NML70052.1 hypothetical protein [Chryseobacterium antibioticum]
MKAKFDGLTEKEREVIKEQAQKAMEEYFEALRRYNELYEDTYKQDKLTTTKSVDILQSRILELIGKFCNPILNFISKYL